MIERERGRERGRERERERTRERAGEREGERDPERSVSERPDVKNVSRSEMVRKQKQ